MTIEFAMLVPVMVASLACVVGLLGAGLSDVRARLLVDRVAEQRASGRMSSPELDQLHTLGRVEIATSASETCVSVESTHRWLGAVFVTHSRARACRSLRP